MSSSIFFRFKSQKEPLQITFDGTSLSVFEVKRDIIALSRLGDGTDFDLEIYTAESNEKYDDDTTLIPRSTTVIARRLPASRPGAGRAARYVTGKMPVNAKNAHRIESMTSKSRTSTPVVGGMIGGGKEMTEEEKLQAMLSANDQTFRAEQEAMSHKPIVRSNKSAAVPDKPLPAGYVCHRCGQSGHWIQACPTNNDPTFDNRPKFRRTTGIPRSFLKVVEKPTEIGADGRPDVSKLPKGVMYTANGEWVVAEADHATWEKIQEKQNAANANAKASESDAKEIREKGLECPIHKGIFNEPVKTPCCETTYCFNCVETAVVESDLSCPNCGKQVLIDLLTPDDDMVEKVKAYEDEKKAEKKQKEKEASPAAAGTPKPDSPKDGELKSPVKEGVPEVKVNGTDSSASTPTSKKRAAEEELPNDRKPSNQGATMKKTSSNQGTPTPGLSTSNTPQPPIAPAALTQEAFQKQMADMAASMNGMQNGMPNNGMNQMPANFNPAMMNPMMGGFNPMMPMGMNMNMPNFGGMNGMPNMNGMNGMPNMNGWNGNSNGMMGQGNWQGGAGRGGMQYGGQGNDSPYMRQPVNPNRHRGRYNRPRSADFRQL